MKPKEAKVYRSIGERTLKNRRKRMSSHIALPVDDFLIEIGRLTIQLADANKKLAAANQRIHALTAQNMQLAKAIPATPGPELVPPQAQVERDVNEAIEVNKTQQPA
jgi:hypothetical protein